VSCLEIPVILRPVTDNIIASSEINARSSGFL
jgi:hypothetical protein